MSTIDDLRRIALALPEAYEQPHFDITSFRVAKKLFVTCDEQKNRATLKLDRGHQTMLFEVRPEAFSPAIWGKLVWTYVELDQVTPTDLEGLVTRAWRLVAPTRLLG